MIWLWIIISVSISLFLLKGKNIAPHNLLWVLIPIDNYGINFAGITIKPIFIFSFLIVVYTIIKGTYRFKLPRYTVVSLFIFLTLLIASMLFRTDFDFFVDIVAYGMFFLTAICAAFSLSLIEGRNDIEQILDVFIATAVGFGIVFIALFTLYDVGIVLPDVASNDRFSNSVIESFTNMQNGALIEAVRLRGFNIDPNASTITFCVGFAALLGKWIKTGGVIKNIIFSLIMIYCIYLTGSRTALICVLIMILVSLFRFFFGRTKSHKKIVFLSVCISFALVGIFAIIYRTEYFSRLINNFLEIYRNRSGVNDEYGRFTIWSNAINTLFEHNWYVGLGMGKISDLISSERHAHNTFIEILCASGVFVCLYYIIFFLSPIFTTIKSILKNNHSSYNLLTLLLSYICIIILISSFSHVASTYMIYMALLLLIIPGCLEEEAERMPSLQ
ncbi:MAG: O-antigen ligase family protein [Ruminococcaceae bacterium]|nr:O-antigen ligase family protein [Oscillospiraceae bacterium]